MLALGPPYVPPSSISPTQVSGFIRGRGPCSAVVAHHLGCLESMRRIDTQLPERIHPRLHTHTPHTHTHRTYTIGPNSTHPPIRMFADTVTPPSHWGRCFVTSFCVQAHRYVSVWLRKTPGSADIQWPGSNTVERRCCCGLRGKRKERHEGVAEARLK